MANYNNIINSLRDSRDTRRVIHAGEVKHLFFDSNPSPSDEETEGDLWCYPLLSR